MQTNGEIYSARVEILLESLTIYLQNKSVVTHQASKFLKTWDGVLPILINENYALIPYIYYIQCLDLHQVSKISKTSSIKSSKVSPSCISHFSCFASLTTTTIGLCFSGPCSFSFTSAATLLSHLAFHWI
jgi:hypothetical protein